MRFTVEIELGNDAMRSYQDIRDALKQTISRIGSRQSSHAHPTDGDGAKIIDLNGNSVGTWGVAKDAPAAITAPPRSASAFIAECNRRKQEDNPPPAPNDPFWTAGTAVQGQCISDEELAAENARITPEERAKLDALTVAPTCPKCGKHEVIIRVDAYANYVLQGWNKDGEPVAEFGEPASVTTFDDRVYMCVDCGYESPWKDGGEFRPEGK